MKDVTTYVGIDAHKKDLFVSMLAGAQRTPPVSWKWPTSRRRCDGWFGSSSARCADVRVFYEAGPCGYALQRQLTTPRVSCEVIALALMPLRGDN